MTSMTDRYVHAVTVQLPESQREDIARELRGTIEDTVAAAPESADPGAAERQALLDLGHPTRLADSYRGEPRSLIGPRFYPAWLRTTKILLALVPAVVGAVLLLVGLFDHSTPGELVLDVLSGAFYAALHVVFWTTLGFAIAERTGLEADQLEVLPATEEWDPATLPEPARRQVTWSDSIASVVTNAFLLVLLVLPFRLGGAIDDFEWGQLFTDTAYSLRWVLATGMVLSLLASVHVLARGRWTRPTAVVNLLGTLLFVGPLVWLAARNDLYAWDTFPVAWVRDAGGELKINDTATLVTTIVVLLAVALWETVDSFRKAARTD
ncbi:HAAS signaling domain-containing protein [Ornithinimicrobium cavernae]|uniref:HAAS signaling domain-containing protein n=1 Tax=Ornithinimicrobium cavernae TaxID=2666047 RepID=UPI000D698B9B|nr:hypothetical protein [Ornithinimicrobium cavernae]